MCCMTVFVNIEESVELVDTDWSRNLTLIQSMCIHSDGMTNYYIIELCEILSVWDSICVRFYSKTIIYLGYFPEDSTEQTIDEFRFDLPSIVESGELIATIRSPVLHTVDH